MTYMIYTQRNVFRKGNKFGNKRIEPPYPVDCGPLPNKIQLACQDA
jgi:hypothetical protein